jgi:hypothetical protein
VKPVWFFISTCAGGWAALGIELGCIRDFVAVNRERLIVWWLSNDARDALAHDDVGPIFSEVGSVLHNEEDHRPLGRSLPHLRFFEHRFGSFPVTVKPSRR